ncbi:unnamed protein product [Rhizophagus irregularis]|nr:unnamed protein product [Rhizophagus irregularis]
MSGIHEYFKRTFSDIEDFLNKNIVEIVAWQGLFRFLSFKGKKICDILNNNEESKRRKMDGEDYKPYFHVKIPPPRVVTPPHLPRTPEHQTFSLSYFVSPTTSESEETDSDDSDAMTRIMMTMIRREFSWTIQLRLMKMVKKIPSVSKEEYICAICIISLKSMANGVRIGFIYRNRLPSLSHILLLQADYFSDLQIEQFSKECIETALDEDLRLKEAERINAIYLSTANKKHPRH